MKDYGYEAAERVAYIRRTLATAGMAGIVYGNSGGKDSALVGILCKMACENTLGLIMPCGSNRNYAIDKPDALAVAEQFGIATRVVDLSPVRSQCIEALKGQTQLTDAALSNMAPRLRMTALYAVAASEGRLVAGTGNLSEWHMGYFTKWGDGAYDFNPIADLTATQVMDFLRYLHASERIIEKAPSAGLFDGQTDEGEMGITYRSIDAFLLQGETSDADRVLIQRFHRASEHKRHMPSVYKGDEARDPDC